MEARLLFVAALFAASVGHASENPEALFAAAQDYVKAHLKDPMSAIFEGLFIGHAENGSAVVCGSVNAKNSYGGYVGRKLFYYVPMKDDAVMGLQGEDVGFDILYEAFCSR